METQTATPSGLVNQRQGAEILGVSPRTFQKIVRAGAIKPVRISGLGRPRFRRADLDELIQTGRAP
jgi:excisionase family DNA binding protein